MVSHNFLEVRMLKELKFSQIGDVAVIDISATTIKEDKSNGQKIPDTETKGLPL